MVACIGRVVQHTMIEFLDLIKINHGRFFDFFPVHVYECVLHDAVEPRPDIRSFFVFVPEPEGFQVGFLQQILGIVIGAGHAQRVVIQRVHVRDCFPLKIIVYCVWRCISHRINNDVDKIT